MRSLPKFFDENLIIGLDNSDDAAVYKLDDEKAAIVTLDFFTPMVDDPYKFGQVAAANSLSDVYAMGGKPLLAMNIVCFPSCLDTNVLTEIMRGGADKVKEAGAILVGGHSVEDNEPKYGLSVVGMVHPDKVLANIGAIPGDAVILTKPLGSGIINTAIKAQIASEEVENNCVEIMSYLNKYAAESLSSFDIHACTDITGFGLGGHLYEIASGSNVSIVIESHKLPLMEGAEEFARMGIIPGGAYKNRDYIMGKYHVNESVDQAFEDIFFDPQTSGGLLICVRDDMASQVVDEINKASKYGAVVVGRIEEKGEYYINLI